MRERDREREREREREAQAYIIDEEQTEQQSKLNIKS